MTVVLGVVVGILAVRFVLMTGHDMLRASPQPEAPQTREGSDDDEPWKRSA